MYDTASEFRTDWLDYLIPLKVCLWNAAGSAIKSLSELCCSTKKRNDKVLGYYWLISLPNPAVLVGWFSADNILRFAPPPPPLKLKQVTDFQKCTYEGQGIRTPQLFICQGLIQNYSSERKKKLSSFLFLFFPLFEDFFVKGTVCNSR